MKTYKYFLLFLIMISFSGYAQNKNIAHKPLIINILIDAEKNVYIEEYKTSNEKVIPSIQKIVNNTPSNKHEGVIYRIFADGSLQHGVIMDVDQLLLEAYQPIKTKTEKYLLDLKENDLDGPDWTKKLNKLDLKASRIN
ncbi:hypothetical protein [Gillisia hiemivivida]|uniref:GLPGLI family protein n=1 Tax=Gillisia hiemivivida TaxID=291190 RepID=A0A5C6ZRZ3_9FLAO|nr:hypothetical protein [Gillisia hiemivivida]TXD93605.1 hypothetical protein ES724_09260 [Gillisia hiemivivida]